VIYIYFQQEQKNIHFKTKKKKQQLLTSQ